jgi:predicted dehydrogenase
MTELRLGVIGCGGMARLHLRNAVRLPGLRLRAYADARPAAAERFLHEYGGDYASDDPHELLRDDSLDAVLIATHHDSHAPLAMAAAAAGKHALVEKPLAMTVEDCLRIEEAVERAGTLLMGGFQRRYAPLVRDARRRVERPVMLVGQLMDNRWSDGHWAQDPVTGGGNVVSQGCHAFDLLSYLARSEPAQVFAAGGTLTHDPAATQVVDNLVGTITFQSGAVAAVIQGDAGLTEYVSKFFFEVFDGRQAIQLYDRLHRMTLSGPDHRPARELRLADVAAAGDFPDVAPDDDPEGLAQELADFVRCAASGAIPETGASARDGTRATAIALALIESVRTGAPQTIQGRT